MRNTTPTRVAGIVAGSLSALLAVVLLLAGGGLLWAVDSKTSSDGYFGTGTHRYATPTRAIATQDIDLDDLPGDLADLRIRPQGDVFVGVARRADVERYLAGVAHEEITDADYSPFKVTYARRAGSRAPVAPASQDFWVASTTGGKPLAWDVRDGHWSVVVMNADGAAGVDVGAKVEVKVPFLRKLAIGLLAGGGILALMGGALLTIAAKSRVATPA
jgi:hypothetical protein